MTYYKYQRANKPYVPFNNDYLIDQELPSNDENDFLGGKAESIADKIRNLYGQLNTRREISKQLIDEVEEDLLDTSSKIHAYRYASFFDGRQKSNLEKKIDLLEKTKRTELVDYWKDTFKINITIFEAVAEYNNIKNKRNLIQ